jgi:nucleoside-diphosphate-sugar epimerase
VIATAARGVRTSVIRLPPTVHSSLDHHGFIPTLIGIARAKGVAGYVGDGANRWPAGHTLDAAHLYRLALESAPAGSRLHAVGDEGVPFKEIAEAIGRNLERARRDASRPRTPPSSSASSATSCSSTTRPRARRPSRSSAGSRSTLG